MDKVLQKGERKRTFSSYNQLKKVKKLQPPSPSRQSGQTKARQGVEKSKSKELPLRALNIE
jgi:hypothetical protein